MADQVERVILEADDRTGPSVRSANRGIESVERNASRAAQKAAEANERAAELTTRAAKLSADAQTLAATSASTAQIAASKRTADAAVREADRARSTAQRATDRAADLAVGAAEKSANRATSIVDRTIRSVEARVFALKSPIEKLTAQRDQALGRVAGDPAAVQRVTLAFNQLLEAEQAATGLAGKLADALRNPFAAAGEAASGFAAKFGIVGVAIAGVAAGIGGAAVQMFKLVQAGGEFADRIFNLSSRLGVSQQAAQDLEAQAKLANVPVESLVALTRKLSDTLVEGGPATVAATRRLEGMGIKVLEAGGNFRDSIDIIRDLSVEFKKFPDHATKVKFLVDIFGRGALEVLPMIENFALLETAAKGLGTTLEDDLITRLDAAGDKMDGLGISFDRLKLRFTEKLIVAIEFIGTVDKNVDVFQKLLGVGILAGAIGGEATPLKLPAPQGTGSDVTEAAIAKDRANEVERGKLLVEQFRNRRTAGNLAAELTLLQTQQREASARIAVGATDTVIREGIQKVDQLERKINQVKGRIKSLSATEQNPEKEKAALALVRDAQQLEVSGLGALYGQRQKALEQYGVTRKAIEAINEAFGLRVAHEERLLSLAGKKAAADRAEAENAIAASRSKIQSDAILRTVEINRGNVEQRAAAEVTAIEVEREARLRSLDLVNAQTLEQKVALEQSKAAIEIDALNRIEVLNLESSARIADRELAQLRILYDAKLISEGVYQAQRLALEESAALKVEALRKSTEAAVAAARESAQARAAQIILEQNQSIFDNFKRQAEGVIDATLTRGQNLFQALGSMLKNTFLTALKDIVATRTAAILTGIATGQKVGLSVPAQSGPLGKLAATLGLGAKPVFGKLEAPGHLGDVALVGGAVPVIIVGGQGTPASAAGKIPGVGGALAGLGSVAGLGSIIMGRSGAGGVGGGAVSSTIDYGKGAIDLGGRIYPGLGGGATPPFIPAGSTGAGGAATGQTGIIAGLKGQLSALGGIGGKFSTAHGGVVGAKGGAMLAGGGILAYDGLRRGGLVGLAETTAGGALIGAKFGGPVGAAIGAAVGFAAGFARLFIKGKAEKIVAKVKTIYGIDITKSFASKTLQPIIDQQFGGSIDVGIRSPAVRDMIELYAKSTGQSFPLSDTKPRAVGLSFRGGELFQDPARDNGQAIGYSGGTARLSSPASFVPGGIVVQTLQLAINGESAAQALTGQIVRSPQAVGTAALAATRASVARRETAVAQSTPGLLLA